MRIYQVLLFFEGGYVNLRIEDGYFLFYVEENRES